MVKVDKTKLEYISRIDPKNIDLVIEFIETNVEEFEIQGLKIGCRQIGNNVKRVLALYLDFKQESNLTNPCTYILSGKLCSKCQNDGSDENCNIAGILETLREVLGFVTSCAEQPLKVLLIPIHNFVTEFHSFIVLGLDFSGNDRIEWDMYYRAASCVKDPFKMIEILCSGTQKFWYSRWVHVLWYMNTFSVDTNNVNDDLLMLPMERVNNPTALSVPTWLNSLKDHQAFYMSMDLINRELCEILFPKSSVNLHVTSTPIPGHQPYMGRQSSELSPLHGRTRPPPLPAVERPTEIPIVNVRVRSSSSENPTNHVVKRRRNTPGEYIEQEGTTLITPGNIFTGIPRTPIEDLNKSIEEISLLQNPFQVIDEATDKKVTITITGAVISEHIKDFIKKFIELRQYWHLRFCVNCNINDLCKYCDEKFGKLKPKYLENWVFLLFTICANSSIDFNLRSLIYPIFNFVDEFYKIIDFNCSFDYPQTTLEKYNIKVSKLAEGQKNLQGLYLALGNFSEPYKDEQILKFLTPRFVEAIENSMKRINSNSKGNDTPLVPSLENLPTTESSLRPPVQVSHPTSQLIGVSNPLVSKTNEVRKNKDLSEARSHDQPNEAVDILFNDPVEDNRITDQAYEISNEFLPLSPIEECIPSAEPTAQGFPVQNPSDPVSGPVSVSSDESVDSSTTAADLTILLNTDKKQTTFIVKGERKTVSYTEIEFYGAILRIYDLLERLAIDGTDAFEGADFNFFFYKENGKICFCVWSEKSWHDFGKLERMSMESKKNNRRRNRLRDENYKDVIVTPDIFPKLLEAHGSVTAMSVPSHIWFRIYDKEIELLEEKFGAAWRPRGSPNHVHFKVLQAMFATIEIEVNEQGVFSYQVEKYGETKEIRIEDLRSLYGLTFEQKKALFIESVKYKNWGTYRKNRLSVLKDDLANMAKLQSQKSAT